MHPSIMASTTHLPVTTAAGQSLAAAHLMHHVLLQLMQ
jgi:hypothetical protein